MCYISLVWVLTGPVGLGGVNVLGHETHQTGVSVSQSHGAHQVDNTNLQKIPHPVATC